MRFVCHASGWRASVGSRQAEVMPPDPTNTERARRLNPPAALTRWLEEVAE
tara:strand:- start:373 stop:525 length:153 start_codon:yes stop_codon:yes gene_type:complete